MAKILTSLERLEAMNLQELDAEALRHKAEAERVEAQLADTRARQQAAEGKAAEIRGKHSELISKRNSLNDAIANTKWYLDNAKDNGHPHAPDRAGMVETERNLEYLSGLPHQQGHIADWIETGLRQKFILDTFPKYLSDRQAQLEKANEELLAYEKLNNIRVPQS